MAPQHRIGTQRWIHIAFILLTTLSFSTSQSDVGVIQFHVQEQVALAVMGNIKNEAYVRNLFDASQRGQLRFSLTPNPNQDEFLFEIDSVTGEMTTAVAIDREQYCPYLEDCYLYIDVSTIAPRFESFTVQVEILDINDFMPYFDPLEVTLTFSEAAPVGTGRSLPLARDLDSPINGVKWYEFITSSSAFELEQTGSTSANRGLRLVVKEPLDRERTEAYTLSVGAYDSTEPDHRGQLAVFINVEDDNDHSPAFVNASYTIHIAEDRTPVSLIASIRAVDLDSGANGRVMYAFSASSISPYEGMFSIDNSTGNVYLHQSLDYETKDTYNLDIIASDSGEEPRFATTNLIIYVIDINDNRPQITINTFTQFANAQIPESAEPDTFVAHIRVSDADATGNNGKTKCTMDHPAFVLEPFQSTLDQYNIYTRSTFNRELQASFTLLIECTDLGQSALEASETFVVEIVDENDNAPALSQSQYNVHVAEDNEIGVLILKLNATDADIGENARLAYSIDSVEIAKYVTLNENTGELRANVRFDYERLTSLEFVVHVRDGGVPQHNTSARVALHIVDINDEAPRFTQSQYIFPYDEAQPSARFVGQVVAVDGDGHPYNQFAYSFVHTAQQALPFEIDADTGGIVATRVFDREHIDVYVFDVKVTDINYPAFSDTAQVMVDIKDVNDNAPRFVFPNEYNTSIAVSHLVPRGTALFTVEAVDPDIDQNANITYQLLETRSQEPHFRISAMWGTVTTIGDLSAVKYKEYDLRLTIRDNGTPVLYTALSFTIVVDSRVPYAGTTEATKQDKSDDGGNTTIIVAVSVVSILVVLSLVGAIAIIKWREWRKPKEDRLDDTPYEAERKHHGGIDGPLSANDTLSITSGGSSLLSSIDGTTIVSYHPTGNKPDQLEKPVISPDHILLYDKKLPQKTYLAQTGDHDTSSSTEDSGRGGSEEGGELMKLQRESQGATPEIIVDSRLPSATQFANNGYTVITHPVPNNNGGDLPIKPARTSSLVNYKPREEGPPSYDSYLRRKHSKRKRVNFALDGVTVGESVTDEPDQLGNDMPYPLHGSCDDMNTHFKPQPKPLRSSLKKTHKRYGEPILHPDGYHETSGRQFPTRQSIDSDHSMASVIV